ncbi:Lrp/AsnC family transcriptional regulator [Sediminibacillus halophilus]|uniref:DNA-binding transcriptional regulator, Lrp family n=1 Tax=Sediminibacillus halophilus TaxID=482461 RepID=A0A1G9X5J6_9BACI|nr:Lrp/AsnC family transcriptional regulator [Sediminibacillus halophilus]SDM91989.1 DNA-binding transcriptional regulator, Lrp family [Sediminibacillus halophilus]
MNEKELEILEILEGNARTPLETIADMIDLEKQEVETIIKSLEERDIILNYQAVINWDHVPSNDGVTAMIDVKVAPKREIGFDGVAERIYRFPEVKAVYLMSGAYDLSVQIEGKTMKEVAFFVSKKLSTLDSVLSTTTHFLLKKYKHDGVIFEPEQKDKRAVVSP